MRAAPIRRACTMLALLDNSLTAGRGPSRSCSEMRKPTYLRKAVLAGGIQVAAEGEARNRCGELRGGSHRQSRADDPLDYVQFVAGILSGTVLRHSTTQIEQATSAAAVR